MSPSQLESFAEEKSKFILEKIKLSTQKITDAKEAAEDAANMKSGWFGKTKKRQMQLQMLLLLQMKQLVK